MSDLRNTCAIHGYEPLPEKYYLVCGECWHVYVTEQDLMNEHDKLVEELGLTVFEVKAEQVHICPLCAHDF